MKLLQTEQLSKEWASKNCFENSDERQLYSSLQNRRKVLRFQASGRSPCASRSPAKRKNITPVLQATCIRRASGRPSARKMPLKEKSEIKASKNVFRINCSILVMFVPSNVCFGLFRNCFNWDSTAMVTYSFHLYSRSSHHFILNTVKFL